SHLTRSLLRNQPSVIRALGCSHFALPPRRRSLPSPPPLPFVVRLSNDERQHSPRLPCLRLPYLSLTLTHQPSAITLSLAGSPAHRRRRSPFVVRLSNHDRSTGLASCSSTTQSAPITHRSSEPAPAPPRPRCRRPVLLVPPGLPVSPRPQPARYQDSRPNPARSCPHRARHGRPRASSPPRHPSTRNHDGQRPRLSA